MIQALTSSNAFTRWLAVRSLGRIGDKRATLSLIHALTDSDVGVRWKACEALGNMGASAILPLIVAYRDRNTFVRDAAAEALHKMDSVQRLPLQVFSSTTLTPSEKLDVLETLRSLRYKEGTFKLPPIPAYCQILANRDDTEGAVREGARAVLTEIANRTNARILLRASSQYGHADESELMRPVSSALSPMPPDQHLRPSTSPRDR